MGSKLACGVLAAAALGAATYRGAEAAPGRSSSQAVYRVVSVTHSSSSRKNEAPLYVGSSTATWALAPATKAAANLINVSVQGALVLGLGTVNVRGTFRAQAKTNHGSCSLVAPTGSRKYPAVAPGSFPISIAADPKASNRVLVGLGPGGNVQASLSNAYFGTECSTSVSGEPDPNRTMLISLPKSTFSQKTVVLRYGGATSKEGIAYRWATVIRLQRIKLSSA